MKVTPRAPIPTEEKRLLRVSRTASAQIRRTSDQVYALLSAVLVSSSTATRSRRSPAAALAIASSPLTAPAGTGAAFYVSESDTGSVSFSCTIIRRKTGLSSKADPLTVAPRRS